MNGIVIIPTYKEKENIAKIIERVLSLTDVFHVLIIDDNSPDGTADIVRSMLPQHQGRLFLEEREGKQGLGTAYIYGFKWALERQYSYLFEMDADFSHNPDDLLRLYDACQNNADVAVGSRYVRHGKVENWPLGRILMSYYASVYVRIITWMPVKDTTAGFVCYRREVLETIDLDKIEFVGYAFQIEMKFASWRLGFKIKEIPITFVDRVEGVSKMSQGIFKEAALGVLQMKWKSFFESYKRPPSNDH